jgi:hypothetical protein
VFGPGCYRSRLINPYIIKTLLRHTACPDFSGAPPGYLIPEGFKEPDSEIPAFAGYALPKFLTGKKSRFAIVDV